MILIAIGANLPGLNEATALENCESAVIAIKQISGLAFKSQSNWYRTAAIPASDQPDYCNGIIRMEGDIDAVKLLATLHAIEAGAGRTRDAVNAPRTLDLDIIDLNGVIRALPAPTLPHPRAHLRAFVLRPILDVAPAWEHPAFHCSVTSLMVDLPPARIQPWFEA